MRTQEENGLAFMKMHGLGNDFVVIDERGIAPRVDAGLAQAMGDRHRGIGFDQLAVISDAVDADLALTFFNADGSLSDACGNATRCIAAHEIAKSGVSGLMVRTGRGLLEARPAQNGMTSVNMGVAQTAWQDIPLAEDVDTLHLPIAGGPTATGMGNPHCTFFVEDAEAIDLASFGAEHEHHPLFPERTNVQVAQVTGPDRIRVRVWERGVGITLASGSSSCAVAVAAARRGLSGTQVVIDLDGGRMMIHLRDDGVWMTGPTAHVFDGVWRL